MSWRKHLDKLGVLGAFIAALCCLGVPAVLSIAGAIGLGFLIKDTILLPLMVLFLVLTLIGLYLGYRAHHQPWALILGAACSVAVVVFVFVHTVRTVAYLALVGLVVASLLNVISRQKSAPAAAK